MNEIGAFLPFEPALPEHPVGKSGNHAETVIIEGKSHRMKDQIET